MTSCTVCNKKIKKVMKIMYTCRCQNVYCSSHLHDHDCTFDHKAEYRDQLRKEMPRVVANKL